MLSCSHHEHVANFSCPTNSKSKWVSKETVSLKIGKNIEMLVCFICMVTQDRIPIDIFSGQDKMHHRYNTKDLK